MKRYRGFTLMELMISLVIAAILASIAVSSYRSTILRSARQLAVRTLVDFAAQQESYKLMHGGYADTFKPMTGIGNKTLYIDREGTLATTQQSASRYRIELTDLVVASTGFITAYALVATPVSAQAADSTCTSWTLTSLGQKSATGSGANPLKDCWP
jgi:type IV pilus assembly protein PilE